MGVDGICLRQVFYSQPVAQLCAKGGEPWKNRHHLRQRVGCAVFGGNRNGKFCV